ncbi:MAG: mannose-1-phosphate guanylyltransferase [Haliea sp.]|nr:mannose-1-phosphate guanylyltransferase [Haliea sp.]
MKVMILAAGLGKRMRPLTEHTPKPLLRAGGKALLEHHLLRLSAAVFREVVINVSHLAEQVEAFCGDGSAWGVAIQWSREERPLETAGGIQRALPLLGDAPFLVVNGDVWTDYPLARLRDRRRLAPGRAHLVLVDNPPQHPLGDFRLSPSGRVEARAGSQAGFTYAGLGVYTPAFFAGLAPGERPLRPLLDAAIAEGRLEGERYPGQWADIGTPERLAALDAALAGGDATRSFR